MNRRAILRDIQKFEVYENDGKTLYDGRYGKVLGITPNGELINEVCCLPRGMFLIMFDDGTWRKW